MSNEAHQQAAAADDPGYEFTDCSQYVRALELRRDELAWKLEHEHQLRLEVERGRDVARMQRDKAISERDHARDLAVAVAAQAYIDQSLYHDDRGLAPFNDDQALVMRHHGGAVWFDGPR